MPELNLVLATALMAVVLLVLLAIEVWRDPDPSALDRYAGRMPQARKVLLDDCGHKSLVDTRTR